MNLNYTGPPGTVIARLVSVDQSGDYTFDTPVKDPVADWGHGGGSYPWRLDQGYHSVLHLKNTLNKEVWAMVQIRYQGGSYNPDLYRLAPFQTIAVDIGQLRDAQKKDIRGNVMPSDVTEGKVVWGEQQVGSLMGRNEVYNPENALASSFSCPNCNCPPWVVSSYMSPASLNDVVGDYGYPFSPFYTAINCSYINYGPYNVSQGASWYSTNPGVASVGSGGAAQCNGTGNANLVAEFPVSEQTPDDGSPCQQSSASPYGSMTVYDNWIDALGVQTDGRGNVVLTQDQYNTYVGQGLLPAGVGVVVAIGDAIPGLGEVLILVTAAYFVYQLAKQLSEDKSKFVPVEDYPCGKELLAYLGTPQPRDCGACYRECKNNGYIWPYYKCPL